MTEYIEVKMVQTVVIPKKQWDAMEDDGFRSSWLEHNVPDQNAVAGEWELKPATLKDYAEFLANKDMHCRRCKEFLDENDADGLVLDPFGDAFCVDCLKESLL